METIRKDLNGIALEIQQRGESFADVIGEDYTLFCSELIANGRKKTTLTKILEIAELLLYTGIALLTATILLTQAMPGITMPIIPAFFVSILLVLFVESQSCGSSPGSSGNYRERMFGKTKFSDMTGIL